MRSYLYQPQILFIEYNALYGSGQPSFWHGRRLQKTNEQGDAALALHAGFNSEQQRLTEAIAQLVSMSIKAGLDHAAFVSARRAARCALLMLASRPVPLKGEQVETLREVARLPMRDSSHSPAMRLALARRIMAILNTVLQQPPSPGTYAPAQPGAVEPGLRAARRRTRHLRR